MSNTYSPGLEGVIAGETAISTVGKKGRGLSYRGYSINDLAEQATFEEVAHLLIRGRLPDGRELLLNVGLKPRWSDRVLGNESLLMARSGDPSRPDLGIFRVVGFTRDPKDGRMVASSGDSYVAAIEFGPTVRARSLIAYGNASQPGSPHIGDQLELFAKKQLKPVWLTRTEIEGNLGRRETVRR